MKILFSLFKKKNNTVRFLSPTSGTLIPITEVNDDVFSQKLIGDGFSILPTENSIYAPTTGTVESIFPTKHAMAIKTPEGLSIMLHMGIDTVELKGLPFNILVKPGDTINAGEKIADMSIETIEKNKKDPSIIVLVTNMDLVESLPTISKKIVNSKENVFQVLLK